VLNRTHRVSQKQDKHLIAKKESGVGLEDPALTTWESSEQAQPFSSQNTRRDMMKKRIALLLALAMVLSLCA
jgi:hypothetical protein